MISFKDNSGIFISELHENLEEALSECGEIAKEYAKKKCPVRTGALKNSIDYDIKTSPLGGKAEVFASMPYWSHVEFGTSRMRAQPYLKPAIADHKGEYIRRIKSKLKE